MNEINPKVSIIMGIYNCENTLVKSIESILDQTYDNWELIMCDDCSKDKTYEIARYFEKKYPNKIKLIKNEQNLSLGPTLNRCLKYVSGKYIARHDADDLYIKDKLEKQVAFLESNKNIDLVGTGMKMFDEGGVYGERFLKKKPDGRDLMKGTTFAHATIMAKVKVYERLSGYSESMDRRGVEDYDLWFRFFQEGFKGYNLNEALYEVREDRDAYKRKNINRRINEIKTMLYGRKLLKLNIKYSLFVIKPILMIIIPSKILMIYHRNKFKVRLTS